MSTGNVILFSTADWDNPFWTNKQHTAKQLAEKGYKVLYVESLGLRQPTAKSSDLTRIFGRLIKFFRGAKAPLPNLYVVSPLVFPFHRFAIVRRINFYFLTWQIKRLINRLKMPAPWVWTYNPVVLDYAEALGPSKIIYHCVDDLRAAPGIDSDLVTREEERLYRRADVIFCTSRKLEERARAVAGGRVHYFGNVVDYEHFSKARGDLPEPEDMRQIPHPRIGFVGALSSYKFDVEAVSLVARERPDWHWVLIGKVGEGQPDASMESLRQFKNIHFLGPKPYAELPAYLKYFDVATIPCPFNDYTQSMFPMKFFEYMAAGKPIVARKIDSLREYEGHYICYQKPEELISSIQKAKRLTLMQIEDASQPAKINTWQTRLLKMLSVLSSAS